MDPADARRTLAYLRLALGALWPVPGLGAKVFGIDPEAQPSVRLMARLFAVRDLALGLSLLQASQADADRQVDLGILVDTADLVAIVAAASRKQVPARMVLLGGTLAGSAIALGLMGRRVDS